MAAKRSKEKGDPVIYKEAVLLRTETSFFLRVFELGTYRAHKDIRRAIASKLDRLSV